ncbi:MAG: hypothetical protein KF730_09720 [Sphingomonas sp.]|uniref:hypothetical protein n=1 Tax=Sphingomonas sp. TaxID=28214 RepID=UPI0025ECEBCE|nr:hypothetical protein [Sphingomonas sp.]MBX3564841.1 hypothetical protein [Sphingomonas sp.]
MSPLIMEVMMGGLGSGSERSINVGNVEDALALDIRALRRLGIARPGECVCDTVRWSNGGLNAPSARLRVDLGDVERGGGMRIVSNLIDGPGMQHVAIEALPTSWGGWRFYLICPITARRCEVLYYAEGRFASRAAQRLSYATQNMTDLSRVRRKAVKLCRRFSGTGNTPRPRGRNRIEIAARVSSAEYEAKAMYLDRLSAAAERSGTRAGPSKKR